MTVAFLGLAAFAVLCLIAVCSYLDSIAMTLRAIEARYEREDAKP